MMGKNEGKYDDLIFVVAAQEGTRVSRDGSFLFLCVVAGHVTTMGAEVSLDAVVSDDGQAPVALRADSLLQEGVLPPCGGGACCLPELPAAAKTQGPAVLPSQTSGRRSAGLLSARAQLIDLSGIPAVCVSQLQLQLRGPLTVPQL
ncbi:hypothetical protein AAFF_G00313770 [Aldrovandia affinis]|uniref:Uncharacterized protein n=1 Tax=Aldrovandia affinis TaxID=143900 RepID=A0AAD7R7Q4_9TELE|nr:hypothetical protein AAFF_G00313770 [Aldrovandia affinis]